ncbi:PREDICTED: uncharacterized protein LOC106817433 [Priapulus caudatus]|uniref:Uncharacterized protein LOC106817433 n=1 Tax=Priapulus caudatus TaxID=37621 RepID=A0ABM1EZG1_PRICU|nr:PREDICTED: uncharacterized protein LOC106817433 [Priapulus caudatus]
MSATDEDTTTVEYTMPSVERPAPEPSIKQQQRRVRSSASLSSYCSQTTLADRKRAKAEAAKARVTFAIKEAKLKKRKAALEADLEALGAQKDLAAAEVEADALDMASDRQEKSEISKEAVDSLPNEFADVRTTNYVASLPLDPTVPPYIPPQHEQMPAMAKKEWVLASDFTSFLLKKELLITSLIKFNDEPQSYNTWKMSFQSRMRELDVKPLEELDLLQKWAGPESQGQVRSLKDANMHNPQRGLQRVWERLDERYGAPEMIESSLRRKLDSFPKLTIKEPKKLYELSDIVSEIESIKEDPRYQSLLGYFDSSSGVTPIANKLPYNMQEKWTTSAVRYIERNQVIYPPFSHFAQFLREQSKIRNNPSFTYAGAKPSGEISKQHGEVHLKLVLGRLMWTKTSPPHSVEMPIYVPYTTLDTRWTSAGSSGINLSTSVIKCEECGRDKHSTALHFDYNEIKQPFSSSLEQDTQILLLIGRDLTEAHHVLDQRIGPKGSPYAQRLSLGWVIVGETCLGRVHRPFPDKVHSYKTHLLLGEDVPPLEENFDVVNPDTDKEVRPDVEVYKSQLDDHVATTLDMGRAERFSSMKNLVTAIAYLRHIAAGFRLDKKKNLYQAQYKRVQLLADLFWKRWRCEFLHTLQGRRKWTEDQRNMKPGDIVLLKDKDVIRNSWPTGVLVRVLPSADEKVRSAEVRIIAESGRPTVYTRPITELVLLVPSDSV